MRHKGVCFIVVLCFSAAIVFSADAAKIVAVSGDVLVKPDSVGEWQAACMDQELREEALIQTQANGRCTVAFDEAHKRLATIQHDSYVSVKKLGPDEIFLTSGRVFSLIEKGSGASDFRVKTPTAISGARGTAWATEFSDGRTTVACFEDVVFVAGVNAQGELSEERDIVSGFGVSVGDDGVVGGAVELSPEKIVEGRLNKEVLEVIVKGAQPGEATEPKSDARKLSRSVDAGFPATTGSPAAGSAVINEPRTIASDSTTAALSERSGGDASGLGGPVPDASVGMGASAGDAGGMVAPEPMAPAGDDTMAMNEPPSSDAMSGMSEPLPGADGGMSGPDMGGVPGADMGLPPDMTEPGSGAFDTTQIQDLTQQAKDQTHDQQVYEQQVTDGTVPPPPPPGNSVGI